MRKITLAAGAAAAALALVGCGAPIEGTVVDKQHRPDLSHWTQDEYRDCQTYYSGSGKYRTSRRSCTWKIRSVWVWIPEKWNLQVEVTEEDGDRKVRTASVGKTVFYTLNIGDHYREDS